MNKIITILLLTLAVHSLYTSKYFEKKGINVRDGIIEEPNLKDIKLETSCNQLDLSTPPYNSSAVAFSGYLTVGKAGSGLAFILYGKEGAAKEELMNHPTVIWLNGGPGSSSQLGNFM